MAPAPQTVNALRRRSGTVCRPSRGGVTILATLND